MSGNDASLEKLKEIVGQIIPQEQADSFVQYARLDAFTDEAGEIDQDKVIGHLTAITLAREPSQQPPSAPNWGQHSGNMPGRLPGADARGALAKRHGVKNDQPVIPAPAGIRPGARAREALERRHGKASK
ncbi:hypothetical protein BN000_01484 [Mycobacterium europaeum]|uniref:Uncharacterized protein n=1 Tax=Mycobacterium europaeum TaxID=761804 RepID=A0A0U1D3I0_9MYCO|nr:hypothetical protein [Mycobacterium europaeum]CQD07430.1 hypothetical protein BN000_01484 [Mycobacterium europaeum]